MDISIIVPFYNGNKYLEQLELMFERNRVRLNHDIEVEIIYVNDSPWVDLEESKLSASLNHQILVNERNGGIHQSRHNGLNRARGNYVLFLDQDDIIEDNCLSSQISKIGNADYITSNGYSQLKNGQRVPLYTSIHNQSKCLDKQFYYSYGTPIISPGQVLIKKDSIPIEWRETVIKNNGSDDTYLWLLMLELGRVGVLNPDKLYSHVATGENTSLNIECMAASCNELIEALECISKKRNLRKIKRRTMYYSSKTSSILTKIKFFDVGINRVKYRRKYE